MKKILFASTALLMVAGAATAEVKVGGNGRMGVVYNGDDWNFSSRIRATFTLSGETDGGLTFGGSFRADNAGNAAHGSAGNVYIQGAFGKLSLGDVVGAAEAALFDLPEIGFSDIASNDTPFLTGDGATTAYDNPVLLYQYTTGDLSLYLSFNDGKMAQTSVKDAQEYAVGANYSFGNYSVGIGYEVRDEVAPGANQTQWTLGGTGTFGTTTVQAYYGMYDGGDFFLDEDIYGIGVTSVFGAVTVKGFVRAVDVKAPGVDTVNYYGLGAAYDLGGGASILGGIGGNDVSGSKTTADFGMKFTF